MPPLDTLPACLRISVGGERDCRATALPMSQWCEHCTADFIAGHSTPVAAQPPDNPQPSTINPQPRQQLLTLIHQHLADNCCADHFHAGRERLTRIDALRDQVEGHDTLIALAAIVPLTREGGFKHLDRQLGTWLRVIIANGAEVHDVQAFLANVREATRILDARLARLKRRSVNQEPRTRNEEPAHTLLYPLGS